MRIAVLALTACGRIGFGAGAGAGGADAGSDGPGDASAWSPFATPQYISAATVMPVNWEPALSPDGSALVFTAQPDTGGDPVLYMTRAQGGGWGAASAIGGAVGSTCSFGPAWSAAGNFYCTGDGPQLYVASFDGTSFGSPVLVPGLTNTEAASPAVAADELELFYTAYADDNVAGTGRATRATTSEAWTDHGMVAELGSLSGVTGWPSLSSDGLTIFVENDDTSTRIYTASRATRGEPFGPLALVTEIDAVGDNGDPEISSDGTALYFASTRRGQSTHWDIFDAVRVAH